MSLSARLSFNLGVAPGISRMFAEWSYPERLVQARACGFGGVEGLAPERPAEFRTMLDALGMSFVCMGFARGAPDRGELGLAGLADRSSEFRDEVARAIDIAQTLGCTRLHPHAGQVANAAERARAKAVYMENMAYACRQAAEAGMEILIEPICAMRQPNYLLHTCAQALTWMDQINAPNLRLILDMFHTAASDESPVSIAESHAPSVGVFQVSQWPARNEPAADNPILRGTLAALKARGWDGWVCAEYIPTGPTAASLAWTENLH